jgi:hypothetical protein
LHVRLQTKYGVALALQKYERLVLRLFFTFYFARRESYPAADVKGTHVDAFHRAVVCFWWT